MSPPRTGCGFTGVKILGKVEMPTKDLAEY